MKNKPKFKLRKTAAYGLVSCMFAGLMMSPIVKADNTTTANTASNETTETQPTTNAEAPSKFINVTVRVTDKTTGETEDFQMIGEEGSPLNVPEIVTILYPLNQYHADYDQRFFPTPTNTLWHITVEKYAEDPYEYLPDSVVDVVRTVNIQYPDGTTETIKHVATKYQAHRKVIATGEIEDSPWRFPPSTSYWEDFTPKAIEGYTPSVASLPVVGEPKQDETVTITYQANQLTGTIQFTDEGQVVGTQTIQGKQGEAQNITLQVPQNYTVEQPTQSFTLTQNNQTFSVPVEHQRQDLPNEERDIVRTVTLVKPDESFDTYKQVSKQSRSRFKDMATGEVIVTSAWVVENGWPAFTFPELEGYRIDPNGMEAEELPLENELWSYHYQYIDDKTNENNNTTTEPTKPVEEPTTNQPVTEEPETTVNPSTPEKPVENETQPSEQPETEVEQPTTKPTDQPTESTETKPSETVETPTDNTSTTPGDNEVEKDTNNSESKPSEEPNKPVDNGSNTSTTTEPDDDTNTESKPTESTKPVENDSKPSEQPSTNPETQPSEKPKNSNTEGDATQPTTPSENNPEVDPKPDGTPVANDPVDKVDEGSNNPIDNGSDKGTNTEPKNDSNKGSSDKENKDDKSDKSKQTKDSKDNPSKQTLDNKGKDTSDKKSNKKAETKQNELPKAGSVEDAWLMALGMGSIVAGLGVATKRRKDA